MNLSDCHVSCEMSLLMPHLATRKFVTCRVCNVLAHAPFLQEKGVRSDSLHLARDAFCPHLVGDFIIQIQFADVYQDLVQVHTSG